MQFSCEKGKHEMTDLPRWFPQFCSLSAGWWNTSWCPTPAWKYLCLLFLHLAFPLHKTEIKTLRLQVQKKRLVCAFKCLMDMVGLLLVSGFLYSLFLLNEHRCSLPLAFFLPRRLLATLVKNFLAGLGGWSSGTVTQLLGGSLSGVKPWKQKSETGQWGQVEAHSQRKALKMRRFIKVTLVAASTYFDELVAENLI